MLPDLHAPLAWLLWASLKGTINFSKGKSHCKDAPGVHFQRSLPSWRSCVLKALSNMMSKTQASSKKTCTVLSLCGWSFSLCGGKVPWFYSNWCLQYHCSLWDAKGLFFRGTIISLQGLQILKAHYGLCHNVDPEKLLTESKLFVTSVTCTEKYELHL